MTNRTAEWNGMNWIRQTKRLAIYLRDGLACVWCGRAVEDGTRLTLDHVLPHSTGEWLGQKLNSESNLVTACETCNKSRGSRSVAEFAEVVADYLGEVQDKDAIVGRIGIQTSLDLEQFKVQAKEMIERRGSAKKVLVMHKLQSSKRRQS